MRGRLMLVLFVLLILVAACGDDEGNPWGASSTLATTTSAPATTTSAPVTSTTAPVTTTTKAVTTTTGGGGVETSDQLIDLMVGQMAEPGSPFDDDAARCFAEGVMDEVGFERLIEIGAGDPSADPEEVFSQMSESEVNTIADVALTCIDVHALFVSQFVEQGLPEDAAICIADGVSGAPWLRDMLVTAMLGEEPDVAADPEAMTMIMDLVQQCAAGG
jgi:hypothetical protein